MKPRCHVVLFLAGLLLLPSLLRAQESDIEAPPLTIGNFENQGSASFGYRFTDIKGFKPMYQELLSLQSGPRLLDFNMSGEAKEGSHTFADSYWLSMSGLGGDPFPTAQFSVTKHRLYDFRVNWRQAYYFWNQNDSVVLPTAQKIVTPTTTGLTENHNWNTVRKFGSVDFTLHATDHLRFRFNYYRTSDTGNTLTTFSPDFLGSGTLPAPFNAGGLWGAFSRAAPYPLLAPINDETNRFTGGVDYTYHSWSFHYALGYQTFNANTTLTNVISPELSINSIAASQGEPLTNSNWSEFRRLTTPISEFSFVGKPLKRLEWRGGYIYYRYKGPFSFDQSFNGVARTNSTGIPVTGDRPYAVSQTARGTLEEPDHIINVGFTFDVNSWWSLSADARYLRMTSEGIGTFASLFNVTTPSTAVNDNVWRDSITDVNLYMDFTPVGTLMIRPGVRLVKQDVVSLADGVPDPTLTQTIKTVRPEISVGFEPSKKFSFRGDLHSYDNGLSYTAITPHTQVGGRAVVQFHPIKKLSLDNELNISNSSLAQTRYRNSIRSDAITVSYAFSDRFAIFGGFTYESLYSQGNIAYSSGRVLGSFFRDQEVNRVWQGGVQLKPTKRFGVRFSGNFDRSTGLGVITGGTPPYEPPAYGPLTWPLATGTAYYNFPKLGQLAVDLQRTYYIEQIVPGNNFSANLLTVRWTRGF